MKKPYLFLLAAFLMLATTNAQVKVSVQEAVNVAARQKMLGQRMAKDKVYLTAHKNIKDATRELKYTIYAFRNDLKILKDFAPTKEIKQKVEAEEHAFEFYQKQILDDSKKSLQAVIKTNTMFLNICNDLVDEIIEYAKTTESTDFVEAPKEITNVSLAASELRYLTQRLNLYYALNEFNIQNVSPSEIENIVQTLDKNINYLTVSDANTLKIDEEINEIRLDWTKLKKEIYTDDHVDLEHKKINSKKLNKICNSILYKANVTEKMYSELNKS